MLRHTQGVFCRDMNLDLWEIRRIAFFRHIAPLERNRLWRVGFHYRSTQPTIPLLVDGTTERADYCSPFHLDWVLGFTVPVQPNLRAVTCQHALVTWVILELPSAVRRYNPSGEAPRVQSDPHGVDRNRRRLPPDSPLSLRPSQYAAFVRAV